MLHFHERKKSTVSNLIFDTCYINLIDKANKKFQVKNNPRPFREFFFIFIAKVLRCDTIIA